jgi:hypothetical protein
VSVAVKLINKERVERMRIKIFNEKEKLHTLVTSAGGGGFILRAPEGGGAGAEPD